MSQPSQPAPVNVPPQRLRNGAGASALVIGVLALVLAVLFIFAPLAAILGAVAVVLGIVGVSRANRGAASNRGQAVAGLITGALGLLIAVAVIATIGTLLARHSLDFRDFGRCMDRAAGADAREACVRELSDRLNR
jgi:uncharacterized membrane protein HdeD (DUF308 family)